MEAPAERNGVNQIILTGIVLSTMPVGEYDRRVVILTKEQGKISAFARGARRPNSPLVGALNPFSFGTFTMYEGRTSYTIQSASISNYFAELRGDIIGAYYGFYFLEFTDYYTKEFNDEREMLKLLYQSFRALENSRYSKELVRAVFELKAITINGEGPQVFACMHCHAKEDLCFFSVKRGGIFCRTCAKEVQGMYISDSTRYTMQYIISTPVARLYSFTVSEEVLRELKMIMKEYMAYYVHHDFKSLSIFG